MTDESKAFGLITGQPTRSGASNRPQRLGEMEIWGLAAYEADKILSSFLTIRSDPSPTARCEAYGQPFRVIADHLFALGILLEMDETGRYKYSFITDEMIREKCKGREISSNKTWKRGVRGTFCCRKCSSQVPFEEILATGERQRSRDPYLTVSDLFAHCGYRIHRYGDTEAGDMAIVDEGSPKTARIFLKNGTEETVTEIAAERHRRIVKVSFAFQNSKYTARKQISADKAFFISEIGELEIRCSKHLDKPLTILGCKPDIVPVPGGLADPAFFGEPDPGNAESSRWAFIRLPDGVRVRAGFPGSSMQSWSASYPSQEPLISMIPVLPLRYRFPFPHVSLDGSIHLEETLHGLYQEVLDLLLKEGVAAEEIQSASRCIFAHIGRRLFGKNGLLRKNGLGRRVDGSARMVIAPDPTLNWDECGIPSMVMLSLLLHRLEDSAVPEMVAHARLDGASLPEADDVLCALKMLRLGRVSDFCRVNAGNLDGYHLFAKRLLSQNSHVRLLLNRQPTLHRYNIQSFKPVLVSPQSGLALRLNPLVCGAFNADFDGDTMSVYLMNSQSESSEADSLLSPTSGRNLISLANGVSVATFEQDLALGMYLVSQSPDRRQSFLNSGFPFCDECRSLLDAEHWDKRLFDQFLTHTCLSHADVLAQYLSDWSRFAL
ncbi:MAG TPA: hypothetical protein PKH07_12210, partial [bacterium]|nr:hypothetical protein [bacterium]